MRAGAYIAIGILSLSFVSAFAAMQSTNYKINFDAIDVGGGRSTSTSFNLEDTVGEIATGLSSSTNYVMKAGYQQMYTSYISISSPPDVALADINGLIGGTSNGSIAWNVLTDNSAGYVLSVQASTDPALQTSGGISFDDYTPASADPDYTFAIVSTTSAFGFSPEGADILPRFKDNSSVCNTGSSDTADACWDGFTLTTKNISQSTGSNHPSGATTTVKVRAEIGPSKMQESGAYSAVITATAVAL